MAKKNKEVKKWITINGQHIPIYEDGTIGSAWLRPEDQRELERQTKIEALKEHKAKEEGFASVEDMESYHEEMLDDDAGYKKDSSNSDISKRIANGEYDHEVGNTVEELQDRLKQHGLELESADLHDMRASSGFNDEKVTMYDEDGNEYEGTYNKYSDGGREIVDIKKKEDEERDDKIKGNWDKAPEPEDKHDAALMKTMDSLQESGKATTDNAEVASQYKLNDNFSVKDNGDGTYDISKKEDTKSRSTRYDDGPGTTKADQEYMGVLKRAREEGYRLKNDDEIEADLRATEREAKKYEKMSMKELKALDLESMSYSELKALESNVSERSFKGERGAKALENRIADERVKKYDPNRKFVKIGDKEVSVSPSKESAKITKGVELARKQLDFDRPGEYAEISDRHWGKTLGVSNDRMAEMMSVQDPKYDYEYRKDTEPGNMWTGGAEVEHHRMYRVPKGNSSITMSTSQIQTMIKNIRSGKSDSQYSIAELEAELRRRNKK